MADGLGATLFEVIESRVESRRNLDRGVNHSEWRWCHLGDDRIAAYVVISTDFRIRSERTYSASVRRLHR